MVLSRIAASLGAGMGGRTSDKCGGRVATGRGFDHFSDAFPGTCTTYRRQVAWILITAVGEDGFERDATGKAAFVSDHPEVAAVDAQGMVHGLSAGSAIVTASLDGKTTATEITVKSPTGDGISFVHDLLPVFSRAGCNAGSCHAKPEGQNGFKLSVFAYDPKGDYRGIVKGDRGRRVFPADPEESLLLKKPTMTVEHAAASGLSAVSGISMIANWIGQGMPYTQPADSALLGVDVYPAQRRYHKGAVQRVVVVARYADGTAVDVTELADFKSNASEIATVDDSGVIKVKTLLGKPSSRRDSWESGGFPRDHPGGSASTRFGLHRPAGEQFHRSGGLRAIEGPGHFSVGNLHRFGVYSPGEC